MQTKSFLIAVILAAATFTFASCGKKKEALQGAVITDVKGSVTLTDAAGKSRNVTKETLYTKEALFLPGMLLTTGADSRADIQFSAGMTARVGASAKVRLQGTRVVPDGDYVRANVQVDSGRLFIHTDKLSKASSVTVTTTTAVAMVRGTEFMVKKEGNKSETLVENGTVQVYDDEFKKEQTVQEGKKADVDAAGNVAVSDLTDADKKDLTDMGQNIQSITENGQKQIQSILENFEENKARIREALDEQKKANEDLINSQKESDKSRVEDQKTRDRAMLEDQQRKDREELDRIRGGAAADKDAIQQKSSQDMDQIKKQSPSSGQDSTRSELEKIKKGPGQ